jgi:diacylglycerol kinase (ATP)
MPTTPNIFKVRFIINPISGKGKNKGIALLIGKTLDRTKFSHEICFTQSQADATRLSREAKSKGMDLVVAVGGDGTVHEVGKALIGSNTVLGIIPTGSGNGLARHCGIPCDPVKAIKLINEMKTRTIDTVKINGDHFLNMAGIGFDAFIAKKFSLDIKRGFFTYLKLVMKHFFDYKCQDYKLVIDGKKVEQKAFLISFANSSQYGNNIRISPQAKIDDGLLDIAILRPFPLASTPVMLYQLLSSKIDNSKYLEIIPAKEVTVEGGPFHTHLDGEPVTARNHLHLSVLPSSLKLVCNL